MGHPSDDVSRKGPNVLISRRVAAVASAAALAVALSGCDADQVGAAAIVGDERITVTQLQDQVREVVALTPEAEPTGDMGEVQFTVLNQLIAFTLLDDVEAEAGVDVTGADIDAFIQDNLVAAVPEGDLTPLLVQNRLTDDTLRQAVRQELILQQLGGPEPYFAVLSAVAEEVGVTVNSRYGVWDGVTLVPGSGSISESTLGEGDLHLDHDH